MDREMREKVEKYKALNPFSAKHQIVFAGSSLMEHFPIQEFALKDELGKVVYNRGIGGFTTDDLLEVMNICILDLCPASLFINIGTNDLTRENFTLNQMVMQYKKIIETVQEQIPSCSITILAYYPMNPMEHITEQGAREWLEKRSNQVVEIANQAVKLMAEETKVNFYNANAGLTDEAGCLKKEFTMDGVHMYEDAYQVIYQNLKHLFVA